ncbi:hypothetical protein D3C81_2172380 [compost metagenome]
MNGDIKKTGVVKLKMLDFPTFEGVAKLVKGLSVSLPPRLLVVATPCSQEIGVQGGV